MKKTLLTILCTVSLLAAAQAQVVINEIMYNPPESGVDSLEYVELFNSGNAAADISGWSFPNGITYTFPAGTILPVNGYVVLAVNANAFKNVFGFLPLQFVGALSNGGEVIRLADAGGAEVDAVTYANMLPWPVEGNGNGNSIVLCDPTSDNSQPINWQACSTPTGITINGKAVFANPNAASACSGPSNLVAVNDQAVVNSPVAATIKVLANDLLPNPVTQLSIVVSAKHGAATVNGNDISYQASQGYCGRDTFRYKVCDNTSCDTAIVFVNVKCYQPRTLEQVSSDDANGAPFFLNADVVVTGVVYGVNLRPSPTGGTLLFTLIDNASGFGVSISSVASDFGYTVKEKDRITVLGTVINVSGLTTVQPDFLVKLTADNPLVTPVVVTKLSEEVESKLIKINNLRLVDPSKWTTGVGTSGFNVLAVSDANPLDTIDIRIDRDVETFNAPVPPQPFNLTGIGSQFDSNSPYTSGYQVLPRYNADISTLPSGVKEADFSNNVLLTPNPVNDHLLLTTDLAFDRLDRFDHVVHLFLQRGFRLLDQLVNLAFECIEIAHG